VNLILSLIAAVAAFTTFVGVAVSTALSVAESRANLATLAAIGAPPGRRRAITASQALLIGGLGSMLGIALGAFIAFTARTTTGSPRLVVPWPQLATTAIGVPLLAALVATACTPRRASMLRRAE
jgi:putative ABC transport system permease protein